MRLPSLNLSSGVGTGLAIGAAAVLIAPVVLPAVTGILKSLAKAGLKGGMILYEKGRIAIDEAKEAIEDLTAEPKAELSEGHVEEAAIVTKKKKDVVGSLAKS